MTFFNIANLYPMISFQHVKTDADQHILTFGEVHTMIADKPTIDPKFTTGLLGTLMTLLETAPCGTRAVPIIAEGSAYNISHEEAKLSPVLASLKGLYKKLLQGNTNNPLELYLVEERGIESDIVHACLIYVINLIAQTTPGEDIFAFYNITAYQPEVIKLPAESFTSLIRRSVATFRFPISVGQFLESRKKNRNKMRAIAEKHAAHAERSRYFTQGLATYTAALKEIDALLRKVGVDRPLWKAFYTLFYDCETAQERLEKLTIVEHLFLQDTDIIFQDFCVQNRLFELLNNGYPAVALFVGHCHAKSFSRFCKEYDWQILSEGTGMLLDTPLVSDYHFEEKFCENLLAAAKGLIVHHASQPKRYD